MICLKSSKSSQIAKNKNSGQTSLTRLILSFLTSMQLILKNSEIKKIKRYASSLSLRNTCAIGCTKKTAENVFKEPLLSK